MEKNTQQLETLLEDTCAYGKLSFELTKLKTIDKATDTASGVLTHILMLIFVVSFFFFINLGLAFWLGDVLGKVQYGFYALAAFYLVLTIAYFFLLHKWVKNLICNYMIKRALRNS